MMKKTILLCILFLLIGFYVGFAVMGNMCDDVRDKCMELSGKASILASKCSDVTYKCINITLGVIDRYNSTLAKKLGGEFYNGTRN